MSRTRGLMRLTKNLLILSVALGTLVAVPPHTATAMAVLPVRRVLLVGGSAANGWLDPHRDSYLQRALTTVHTATGQAFKVSDHTIPGETAVGIGWARYQRWVRTVHPDIVILSWGLLNDVHQHTPMSAYDAAMLNEIALARQAGADVLLVTPPVTKASATNGWPLEHQYMQAEIRDAEFYAVRDKHVHVIDLFSQMQAALTARGQTYRPYSADWAHPNRAGHRLAGQLLAEDLLQPYLRASLNL